jgi:hypothetical protein
MGSRKFRDAYEFEPETYESKGARVFLGISHSGRDQRIWGSLESCC